MIPKPVFWFILILIVLLPFTRNWRLLVFGEYTWGQVKEVRTSVDMLDQTFGGETSISVIEFTARGKIFKVNGPIDLKLPEGKKIPLVYKKEDPQDCLILNLRTVYLGKTVILPGVLLVLWLSFYSAMIESNKPRWRL